MAIKQVYTADASQLLREEEKMAKSAAALDVAYKKNTESAKAFEREAKKVFETTRTPMERYNHELEKLDKLLQKGKINQETYNRAAAQAKQTLDQNSGAMQKQAEAAKKQAEALRLAKQETDRVRQLGTRVWDETRTPLEKYNERIAHLRFLLKQGAIDQGTFGRATDQAKEALDAAGDAAGGAFGPGVLRNIGTYGGAIAIATAGLREMWNALQDINAEHQKSAELTKSAEGAFGPLAQLGGDEAATRKLIQASRQFFAAGGANTLEQAARDIFEIESAGKMADLPLMTELGKRKILEDAGQFIKSATTLQTTIGAGETGDTRQLLSKALAASATAPASAESILAIAAESGGVAKTLGLSDEELLTAGALLSKSTGNDQRARTQLRSLLDSIAENQSEIAGKTLEEMVQNIEGKGMSFEELKKMLGRTEAVQAFQALSGNQELFRTTFGDITAAGTGDLVEQAMRNADADASIVAAREARISEQARQAFFEQQGMRENLQQAGFAGAQVALAAAGASDVDLFAARRAQNVADVLPLGQRASRGVAVAGAALNQTVRGGALGVGNAIGLLTRIANQGDVQTATMQRQLEAQQQKPTRREAAVPPP